jgi:hypothetical protein
MEPMSHAAHQQPTQGQLAVPYQAATDLVFKGLA